MKLAVKIITVLLGLSVLAGLVYYGMNRLSVPATNDEEAARKVIEEFGSRLKNVSLLAPADVLKQSMEKNYKELVVPALLSAWEADPSITPGRLTSSPWPDRIEITSMSRSNDTYKVEGFIIELTSVETTEGGKAARIPISLAIVKQEKKWLINAVMFDENPSLEYRNDTYGFYFTLPDSWEGYSIVKGGWEGNFIDSSSGTTSGPLLSIRHPDWSEDVPRQDIPIMIFTHSEWEAVVAERLSVGAAPIPPSELGQNTNYVFALPARYNFAFPVGFEEVEQIIAGNPLRAF
ncbi:MAG: hypothetical protein WC565_02675 [Parcubacteria group bacterium]